MESTEPAEPIETKESTEPAEKTDATEPADPAENAAKNEANENPDAVEALQYAEASESADANEAMERALLAEMIDMMSFLLVDIVKRAERVSALPLDGVKWSREDETVNSPTPSSDARAALLDAARAELLEQGPAALGLRAVARRAGLSHAAPGYFFGDRAGMLTALATQGFVELAEALERDAAGEDRTRLARLGDAYIAYGLANGALYDLMFHRDAVHPDDADLQAAKAQAIEPLLRATEAETAGGAPIDAMMSWALVHGLVTLAREGALPVSESALMSTLRAVTARLAERLEGGSPI